MRVSPSFFGPILYICFMASVSEPNRLFVPAVFSLLSSEDLFRVSTMSQVLYVLQPLLSLVSNSCLFPHRDAGILQLSILSQSN